MLEYEQVRKSRGCAGGDSNSHVLQTTDYKAVTDTSIVTSALSKLPNPSRALGSER